MYSGKDGRVVPLFKELFPFGGHIGSRQPLAEDRGPDSLEGTGAGIQHAFFTFGPSGDGRTSVPRPDSVEAFDGAE